MSEKQNESTKAVEVEVSEDQAVKVTSRTILEDPRMKELIQMSRDNDLPMLVSISNEANDGIYEDLFSNQFGLGKGSLSGSLLIATISGCIQELLRIGMPREVVDAYVALINNSKENKL